MQYDPKTQYEERLAHYEQALAEATRKDDLLANLRLTVFVMAIVQGIVIWQSAWLTVWTLLMPLVVFVALMVAHNVVLQAKTRACTAIDWYQQGLARIEDRWAGTGNPGTDWQPPDHPYAYDLDCFGKGSLFELLCQARTRIGEARLADWLLQRASIEEIETRQAAVEEWRMAMQFREDLALLGGAVRGQLHPKALLAWADQEPRQWPGWMPLLAWGSTAAALVAIPFWSAWGMPVFFAALLLNGMLLAMNRKAAPHAEATADRMRHELKVLAVLLQRIEDETVACAKLQQLQAKLKVNELKAAESVEKLDRLMGLLDMQRNQFFLPIAILLAWDLHLTRRIEAWRRCYGPHLGDWLDALGEAEALASLAAYAFEHPEDPFPMVEAGEPFLEGTALGHPLVPQAECVRNSIHLKVDAPALLVSGSNMSGKSTYLRTIGINVLLAQMGAPVRAEALRLSPLAIGATLRVQDSLQDGASRFYAEIQRFKTVLELCDGETPVLFLADEILHGTNSHDRVEGATGLIQALLDKGAIGLVTTHDLTLTQMDAVTSGRVRNVHFQDHLENDKLSFDYTLREGVVTHSNALQLMRSIGLPV